MATITMSRSIFICSIFATLFAATSSKSIDPGSNKDTEITTTDARLVTILPDLPLVHEESDEKLGSKRSLLVSIPIPEETNELQDTVCKCEKSKRCKTSNVLRHSRNPYDHRDTEYSVVQGPRLRLVSLKNPRAALEDDPSRGLETEEEEEEGDNAIVKAIREKLKPYNVGAVRRPSQKTSVIKDDKYVCYCRMKNNPKSLRKEAVRNFTPKSPWLTRKQKPEKKEDQKVLRNENRQHQQPMLYSPNVLHRPILSGDVPMLHPDAHRYFLNPILQRKGIEGVPYVPYVYHIDPEYAILPENPTRIINLPFKSIGGKPESIVGQRAPIGRGHDFNENEDTVGQHLYTPNVDKILLRSSEGTTPAASSKTTGDDDSSTSNDLGDYFAKMNDEPSTDRVDSDYNLQSTHSALSDHTEESGIMATDEEKDLPSDIPSRATPNDVNSYVQTVDPGIEDATSSMSLKIESAKEYETTDKGTLDYSEIEEVTNTYFTSKAYSDETDETNGYLGHRGPSSFDQAINGEPTNPAENRGYDDNAQSLLNTLTGVSRGDEIPTNGEPNEDQSSMNVTPDNASLEKEDIALGKSSPQLDKEELASDQPDDLRRSMANEENSYESNDSSTMQGTIFEASKSMDDRETSSSKESLQGEKKNLQSDKSEQIDHTGERDEERLVSDYTTIDAYTGNEKVATTIRDDDKGSLVASTSKSLGKYDIGGTMDPSGQTFPFCDNTFLQKAITDVINKFATDDSSPETDGNDRETVGSTNNNLLDEIVKIPNLRGIVAMPSIERTILQRVKNLLARLTSIPRKNFDTDWATNTIRNHLRNTMAAAPISESELPPMTVKERQFKNGKWVTNLVTLEPTSNEESPTNLDKLKATVRDLVRDPAVSLQAAEQPAVRNMIVQSVRNTFEPENSSNDQAFDESVIQGALDNELALMKMEDAEVTTMKNAEESATIDASNIDMEKLLNIAKNEAGMDEEKDGNSSKLSTTNKFEENFTDSNIYGESSVASVLKSTEENIEGILDTSNIANTVTNSYPKDVFVKDSKEKEATSPTSVTPKLLRKETVETTVEPSSYDFAETTRTRETVKYSKLWYTEATTYPTTQDRATAQLPEENETEKGVNSQESKSNMERLSNNEKVAGSGNQDESSTVEIEDYTLTEDSSSSILSTKTDDAANGGEYESTEGTVGMKISIESDEASPEHDYTYLGNISVKKNFTDDAQDLRNSELYYVGDGVKLPLEIRKLNDGSYALSISRIVCERLLNKECPCCVPLKGNVVCSAKNNPEGNDNDETIATIRKKRISKRETTKSILSNESRDRDSADDNLQILSMPVETFARRYNLSLNLQKVQVPWNFDAKKKIDDHPNGRAKNVRNEEEDNTDTNLRRLLSVHAVSDNDTYEAPMTEQEEIDDNLYKDFDYKYQRQKRRQSLDRYRHQRNIDDTVNKRVEIATNVLNWLRDIFLTTTTDS